MKYDEILPTTAMWRDQAYAFLVDWLRQISKENKKGKRAKRGMPYKRTLKQWSAWYGDQDVADIARGAMKIMDVIAAQHPELKKHL